MTGQTVVLTRDEAGNQRWAAGLRRAGFSVLSAPMIETASLDADLPDPSNYDWLVLTSPRAVSYVQSQIENKKLSQATMPPVAAVGSKTAAAAIEAGWEVKFQPRPSTAAALGRQLEPVNGRCVIVARSQLAGTHLAAALRARGANIIDLPIYTTQARANPDPALAHLLASGQPAVFVLASPSAVGALSALHPEAASLQAIAIGPTTAAAALAVGFSSVRQAAAPGLPSIISALQLL